MDWVRHWMNHSPDLLGGYSGDALSNFEAFWRVYQMEHPGHSVFTQHMHRLNRVVPLLLHGDEGRAVKRTNYLVMSMESPLGSLADPNIRCDCCEALRCRRNLPTYGVENIGAISTATLETARKQLTNYKGHSFLSKWLLFGVGGWVYKKHPEIVEYLMEAITENLTQLFVDGVTLDSGEQVFGAVIAIKGDLDFHKKTMNLTRSYANVGTRNEREICHACLAGGEVYKFEDYSERPQWEASIYVSRPWSLDDAPVFSRIPYDGACPEQIVHWDLFHVHKLGVCRDAIGGILILLLRLGFFDYAGSTVNIDDRFKRAHSMFSLWCSSNRKSPGLRSFSKAFFNMKSLVSAPWVSSKGSDSMLLLEWLRFTLKLNIANPIVGGHESLLSNMLQLCESCLDLRMVHRHKLFLERMCAIRLYVSIMTVLRSYTVLAKKSITLRVRAFVQKPKQHALHHIAHCLKRRLEQGCTLIDSPQMSSCEGNEDYVGRISRLSRRVSFKLCDLRVCHRYFFKITALLQKRRRLKTKPSRARKWDQVR